MPRFNLKPTLCTYLHLAYPCGMLENPALPAPLLNWNIQWAFLRAKRRPHCRLLDFSPSLGLRTLARLGLLIQRDLPLPTLLPGVGDPLRNAVRSALDAACFVYAEVDYYHIEGTAEFQRKHFCHPLLLFAEDPDGPRVQAALYTRQNRFGQVAIDYQQLAAALLTASARPRLWSVRPALDPPQDTPLDVASIKLQLESYLRSTPLPRQSAPFLRCRSDTRRALFAFGLAAYDEMAAYFARKHAAGSTAYDTRLTRLVWEHKRLMRLRLERLQAQLGLPAALLLEWDGITQLAYWTHLTALAASRRQDAALFGPVGTALDKLRRAEDRFLTQIWAMI